MIKKRTKKKIKKEGDAWNLEQILTFSYYTADVWLFY